ncbi:MAG: metal-dependent transcriptional regulator [Spirochaetales bacterium]|nr:metal-dependent transcriptional regulator [Spirochaetales bacterium]
MQSSARENYLKTILELQEAQGTEIIKLNLIAKELGLAAGTVTGMVKALTAEGFLEYRAYVGCRLTTKGRKLAVTTLRNHRIIELFLVDIVGMDWSEVHDEADRIEHALSPKVVSGIDKLLGYPVFDPHGDPIPTADGEIPKYNHSKLHSCKAGDTCEISRILDESKQFLSFIGDIALYPGTIVHIDEIQPEAGIIRLRPEGAEPVVLSLESAEKLLIKAL